MDKAENVGKLDPNSFYDLEQLKVDCEALRTNIARLEVMYNRMSSILDDRQVGKIFIMDIDEVVALLDKMGSHMDEVISDAQMCIDRDENFPWD